MPKVERKIGEQFRGRYGDLRVNNGKHYGYDCIHGKRATRCEICITQSVCSKCRSASNECAGCVHIIPTKEKARSSGRCPLHKRQSKTCAGCTAARKLVETIHTIPPPVILGSEMKSTDVRMDAKDYLCTENNHINWITQFCKPCKEARGGDTKRRWRKMCSMHLEEVSRCKHCLI
jgi:hypothetical protein